MLQICICCETITHCDLFPCQACAFQPAASRLCCKILSKLRDGNLVICDKCHAETIVIFFALFSFIFDYETAAKNRLYAVGELMLRIDTKEALHELLAEEEAKRRAKTPLRRNDWSEHFKGLSQGHELKAKSALNRHISSGPRRC